MLFIFGDTCDAYRQTQPECPPPAHGDFGAILTLESDNLYIKTLKTVLS